MEYNSYYPAQPGHPPPIVTNQQHGSSQMQQQPPPGGQLMHAPMPPQNIRQNMPPGPPSHHQQQMQQMQQHQQQQHLGHHSQQMPSQQQHPNYHQIQPPHPHRPPVSHSGSPHPQQHHNHQPALTGPPPQQPAIQTQQHHMHPQSPHHQGGPPMHMQQSQQPPQQLNQMVRPPLGPSVMNHPQPGLQQPSHHNQNFFTGGPIPHSNLHHYPQQNQHPHHHHHQPHPQHPHHPHQHHHQPPMMPPLSAHHPHIQQGIGRNSPYYPTILQTEFRVIELNRRLQSRPISRHPPSPLPTNYDESIWWERFTSEFFEDDATLTMSIRDEKPQEYTIGRTLIPKFFRTYFEGGATDLSISLRNPREACTNPHTITLNCDQAFLITNNIFRNPAIAANQPVVVHTEGHLTLDFVSNNYDTLSIKSWKFYTRGFREYIDRSMTAMGLNTQYLAEPLTRQGLPKSSTTYLKMCMIMEPMQDLMFAHKQTKLDPRSCLRKLLFDRYKFSSGEDNRVATNKRNRKRKSSAAPALTGTTTNKKSKSNVNNPLGNNSGLSNNIMMSPSGTPSFPLASQDVMVVGEPSMMGGDFGDDNERMITRLENTQYDPTASTPSNADESDSMNTSTGNDNGICNNNNVDTSIDNHTLSPSLLQQRQHHQQVQQQPVQVQSQLGQVEQLNMQEQVQEDSTQDHMSQPTMIENPVEMLHHHQQEQQQQEQQQHEDPALLLQQQNQEQEEELAHQDNKQSEVHEEAKIENSIAELGDNSDMILGVNSIDQLENHTTSIQPMNEESNSDSQLPCSTASANSTMEQQQPVDNGVA